MGVLDLPHAWQGGTWDSLTCLLYHGAGPGGDHCYVSWQCTVGPDLGELFTAGG